MQARQVKEVSYNTRYAMCQEKVGAGREHNNREIVLDIVNFITKRA